MTSAREPRRSPAGAAPVARSWAISLSRAHSRSASRRELANTMVDRCCADQVEHPLLDGRPDRRPPGRPSSPLRRRLGSPRRAMSSTGTSTLTSMVLAAGGCTIVDRPRAAEEPGHLLDRPDGGGQADPLGRAGAAARRAAPATAPGARRAWSRPPRAPRRRSPSPRRAATPGPRGQQQEQRLRRGDEDVRRAPREAPGAPRRGCRPERMPTRDVGRRQAEPVRRLPDAGQRRAQVALDVDGERLERARRRAPGSAVAGSAGGGRRPPAGPATRGRRPASCRSRSAPRPGRARPARSRPRRRPGPRSVRRRPPRTRPGSPA